MRLKIKGMVCNHCVEAVRRVLSEAGLTVKNVSLGEAEVEESLDDDALRMLDSLLASQGFSRPISPDEALVERIKQAVIRHVRAADRCRLNLSACLEEHLHTPYDTLSRVFSSLEGRTVEKYQIAQRVEWVKELLGYGEMTVAEIADYTGYSSAAHLSRQFKSVTGLTPSQYQATTSTRHPLNEI
ncbi:MAG: helix-turn-helix domain-containing protein [Muribaculaceae bacterium]|nr:helix-turn-helix domain-containing protein [Muribaculaceae bacterium]